MSIYLGTIAVFALIFGQVPLADLEQPAFRASHAPIVIDTDAGLLLPDAVSGNGVVSGKGTANDPYVIAGWSIAFRSMEPAITIRATTMHLLLRDIEIHAAEPPQDEGTLQGPALLLQNAQNVRWEGVSIRDAWTGAWVEGSDIVATDTVLEGSTLELQGAEVRMTGLVATGGGPNGAVFCRETCSLAVENARISLTNGVDRGSGPRDYGGLVALGQVELRDVSFNGAREVAGVRGSGTVTWSKGSVEGRAVSGELAAFLEDVSIARDDATYSFPLIWTEGDLELKRVTLEGPASPAVLAEGASVSIEDSHFRGHQGALKIANPSAKVVVHRSSFESVEGIILDNEVGASVDARWNVWDREPREGTTTRGPMMVEPWEGSAEVRSRATPAALAFGALAAIVTALALRRRR